MAVTIPIIYFISKLSKQVIVTNTSNTKFNLGKRW